MSAKVGVGAEGAVDCAIDVDGPAAMRMAAANVVIAFIAVILLVGKVAVYSSP